MNSNDNTIKNHQYSGRYLSFDKRKAHQRSAVIIFTIVLALLILAIVLLSKVFSNKNTKTELVGVWRYDQYTEYEFIDSSRGCMCLDSTTHYEFTYKTKENILYIDFSLDYVTDCQYTYALDGDKLTLIGGEGTAEIGKVYELSKIK